ncbi:hypothetical protein HYN56_01800 [Flavobacterium crocinum]|uniref:Polysaccharide biosynthesis protein n=1 Tax=Flavobacterium crocinum TaxID=2183896 RepID=A0A2S1YG53_9FLAO|nr:oligosaccharide flippase family protein [Flavobacterium crocinum]AWK03016.1 hypothetical protein HYN56_01800 [Flavobacterium crocinum]
MKNNFFKSNKIAVHEVTDKLRDKNLIRQIFSSISFKAISIAIGLILVPVLLKKLGQEKYGIWALLLSLIQWVSLMDIGIGNGLRIKLTEALSKNKQIEAKEYVSTAYYLMSVIAIPLMFILLPMFFLFNWSDFFNSKDISLSESRWIVMIFVYSMIMYFVLSLVNQVMYAVQRSSLTSIAPILTSSIFIFIIYFFSKDNNASLLFVCIVYALCLILAITIISAFFYKEYSNLFPRKQSFKKDKIKPLLSLGVKFFIIQITGVIIFSSDNIIITQLLGPKFVAVYNIPFVIFNNISMLANIVMMPIYSSYTEAYSKGNLDWIKTKVVMLCRLMIPFTIFVGIVVFLFPTIIKIWVGDSIDIPDYLPLLVGLYSIVTVWNNIFSYVLGGIGKINLGMYTTIAQGILNIPLSIYFAKYCGFGINGIIIGNIICLGISSIISPIQVYYFIFYKKHTEKLTKILS